MVFRTRGQQAGSRQRSDGGDDGDLIPPAVCYKDGRRSQRVLPWRKDRPACVLFGDTNVHEWPMSHEKQTRRVCGAVSPDLECTSHKVVVRTRGSVRWK